MDNSQIENKINEIRKRSGAVAAFNTYEIPLRSFWELSTQLGRKTRTLLKIYFGRLLINYWISNTYVDNVLLNIRKRNRPTFDGKTIPHELTLAEVTR